MKYTNEELELLKKLYENIGTFSGVAKNVKQQYGHSISDTTIKYKLEEKFQRERLDFESWINRYNKYIPKYSEYDLKSWELLYEQIGSFLGVSNYLKRNNMTFAYDGRIKKKLKEKFINEGRDFKRWIQMYDRSIERSGFKKVYNEDNAREWKKLYEQIGTYKGVIKYLKKKYGESPHDTTIKYIIKELLNQEGKDFELWEVQHSQVPLGLTQGYLKKDIEKWEPLYEEIGSFEGVSEYIKEKEGTAPADITIKRQLKKKFYQEKRDFNSWIEEHEDWHFKIYSDKEVMEWINLFKRIGSFYGVEKFLGDRDGTAPDNYTISTRIRKKFEKEGINFEKWRAIYGQNYYESICRFYFKSIFKARFPTQSPEWLKNPKTGRLMHLDGYNKVLNMAFELNGPQHYEFTRPYHKTSKDLYDQQDRDNFKVIKCKEKKVLLFIISYTIQPYDMQDEIIKQYENMTDQKLHGIPVYDHLPFFYDNNLERFLYLTENQKQVIFEFENKDLFINDLIQIPTLKKVKDFYSMINRLHKRGYLRRKKAFNPSTKGSGPKQE